MEPVRKPFQGVWNIVRFNRHIYVLSAAFLTGLLILSFYLPVGYHFYFFVLFSLAVASILISLGVSYYIYDVSHFYTLDWLPGNPKKIHIVNIHAGFDETSALLKKKYSRAQLTVLDFYDPAEHTEVSIKRARKAYLPFPGTERTSTSALSLTERFSRSDFCRLCGARNQERRGKSRFLQRTPPDIKTKRTDYSNGTSAG